MRMPAIPALTIGLLVAADVARGQHPTEFEIHLTAPSPAVPPAGAGGSATAAIGDLLGCDAVADNLLDVDTGTGNGAVLGPLADDVMAGLAWDPDNQVLYGASSLTNNLYRIDPTSGATTLIGDFGVALLHGLGYDSNDDVLYGITNQFGTRSLYRLDVGRGAATLVGAHGKPGLTGLAFDPGGDVMYASDAFERALYTIDLGSGAVTLVGPFGVGVQAGVGLAFDPTQGLFTSDNKQTGTADDQLYAVDTSTGAATLVGNINHGNVLGLTFQSAGTSCGVVYCDTNPANCADIAIDTCDCAAGSIHVSMSNACVPDGQFTYLLVGAGNTVVTDPPGAVGDLCIAGGCIGRYALDSGPIVGGGFTADVLNAASGGGGGDVPTCGGNLCAPPGQTWNFQYWHRDGMSPSRFSKALSVTF